MGHRLVSLSRFPLSAISLLLAFGCGERSVGDLCTAACEEQSTWMERCEYGSLPEGTCVEVCNDNHDNAADADCEDESMDLLQCTADADLSSAECDPGDLYSSCESDYGSLMSCLDDQGEKPHSPEVPTDEEPLVEPDPGPEE